MAIATDAAAGGGLSGADRKALDIRSVDGATTPSVTMVEIEFAGDLAGRLGTGALKRAQVTIELTGGGPATVITDRKASSKPKEGRSGTNGRFDVVRTDRGMLVLVEELPRAPETVKVSTLVSAASGRVARGAVSDVLIHALTDHLVPGDSTDAKVRDAEKDIDNATKTVEDLDQQIDKAKDKIAKAKHDLRTADSDEEEENAKARLKKFEEKRQALEAQRAGELDYISAKRRWIDELRGVGSAAPPPQCRDGRDNDNDALVDHPADPGCVDPNDNDEKNESVPLSCPVPGQFRQTVAGVNTPLTNTVTSFGLSKQGTGQLVLTEPVAGPMGGPAALPGNICGADVNVNYDWIVFSDGDPYGLPDPPPGDQTFRITIFAQNPNGSGNPGGTDGSMSLSLGTAKN